MRGPLRPSFTPVCDLPHTLHTTLGHLCDPTSPQLLGWDHPDSAPQVEPGHSGFGPVRKPDSIRDTDVMASTFPPVSKWVPHSPTASLGIGCVIPPHGTLGPHLTPVAGHGSLNQDYYPFFAGFLPSLYFKFTGNQFQTPRPKWHRDIQGHAYVDGCGRKPRTRTG